MLLPVTMTSLDYFHSLTPYKQGLYLLNAPTRKFTILLKKITDEELVVAISALDPDHATDVVQKIVRKKHREKIVTALNTDLQEKINFLFRFNPNTAGGIMDVNYIIVQKKDTLASIKKRIAHYEKQTGKIPTILVQDKEQIVGEFPYHAFIVSTSKTKIGKIMHLPTIHHAEKTSTILKTLKANPHKKAVVVDDSEDLLGILYSDDLIQLLSNKQGTSLYDFAGVHGEEDVFDPIMSKVTHRYKWLIINLFTAYLAAMVISLFEETLSAYVLLAAYMPIVAGMGGNAGTQTLAVMVRSIATGEITLKNAWKPIFKEVSAGAINGIVIGTIVAFVATLWHKTPLLGLITGTAIVVNLIVAGFFGALIPLIMKRLGKDPATSATIFITTATDVFGFFAFLGLATVLLV